MKLRPLPLLTATLALVASGFAAEETSASLATGLDFSTGKYGGSTTSTSWSAPLDVTWREGDFNLGVSTSWLRVSGAGASIPGIGPIAALRADRGLFPRLAGRFPVPTANTTASGFGDVALHGGWSHALGENAPTLGLGAALKLGTADAAKGLGSGENDWSADVSLSGGGAVRWHVSLGYQLLGDPEGVELDNGLRGSLSFAWATERAGDWELGWDGAQSTNAGTPAASALRVGWSRAAGEKISVSLYASKGLSDASPDFGAGLSIGVTF